jgi:hypothetical protein
MYQYIVTEESWSPKHNLCSVVDINDVVGKQTVSVVDDRSTGGYYVVSFTNPILETAHISLPAHGMINPTYCG